MKLPNHDNAIVPQRKITAYLLSSTHPDGWNKEQFFIRFGFSVEKWTILADALLGHAAENEVTRVEESAFGNRYVIEGIIHAPDGRTPSIRSVWFIEKGETYARFVTAYPL